MSGGELNIYWAGDNSSLVMSGTASTVFEGRIKYDNPIKIDEIKNNEEVCHEQVAKYLIENPNFFHENPVF